MQCGSKKDEQMEEQDKEIQESLSKITHKLIVMSGKGGVGKSTVAVNLAAALARKHFKVGLMDADLYGPSIPTMLGLEGQPIQSASNKIMPLSYQENLKVISIGSLISHKDDAIIWRGPLKIGAIRQFISDVEWGSLDFLIVDSPPGTGDEPLTVAQTIKGASAIIVTTPQEISLIDVRKCINFCRQVGLPIRGLIENMSGFICPYCDRTIDVFKRGGGEKAALQFMIPFLGSIPIDPGIVESGDMGRPYYSEKQFNPAYEAFEKIVEKVREILAPSLVSPAEEKIKDCASKEVNTMKIAVPAEKGRLCMHFGHCEQFAVIIAEAGRITEVEYLTPPPHEPGVLPQWLSQMGVNAVIAGGMGTRAQNLFFQKRIQVFVGAPQDTPENLVNLFLSGNLKQGVNVCDH